MKRFFMWLTGARSIRVRVLTIVAIPSTVLLISGVGLSIYLIEQGNSAKIWAAQVQAAIPTDIRFISQVEEERRLTLLRLGGGTRDPAALAGQRQQLNLALADLETLGYKLLALNPSAIQRMSAQFAGPLNALPAFRQKIDAGGVSRAEAYAFYNRLVDLMGLGVQSVAQSAPDSTTTVEEATSADLLDALDAMSRANALAGGDVGSGGLSQDDLREYRDQVGFYHEQLQRLLPRLDNQEQAQYRKLVASPAWQRLTAVENTLIDQGAMPGSNSATRPLPLSLADWQDAAGQVTADLTTIWSHHHNLAEDSAAAYGNRTFRSSLLAGGAILVVTVVALLIAIRLSNRLIRRLKRLRDETLEMADRRLPEIVVRLRDGVEINPETAVPTLDHGQDEVGEVAAAFNKAQQTAVAAAAQEAKTFRGMNAVFLNIAHRSQVVVRRQLEVLDEAESKQEDPTHLELLFHLDHLATRARRNAENLVILGGGRPGRKWRNAVSLDEIVRSAVSETEDFARIGTVRVPDVAVKGTAVADLIHLIAELVDNATSFSPPGSRVEVRGNQVGKGVVIEIEDQGLGMAAAERDQLNAMLHNPPDFQVMAMSGQLRLGLFVVAQLAARHAIAVSLTESDYGGIRAIILIPISAIAADAVSPDADRADVSMGGAEQFRPPRRGMSPGQDEPSDVSWFDVRWPEEDGPHDDVPSSTPVTVPASHIAVTGNEIAVDGSDERTSMVKPRAPLPRRQRQANLAPQLAAELTSAGLAATPQPPSRGPVRSPEQARDTMAAVLRGTRNGRRTKPRHGL